MSYEWIEGGWDGTNASFQRLDSLLHRLSLEKSSLSFQVEVKVMCSLKKIPLFEKFYTVSFKIANCMINSKI